MKVNKNIVPINTNTYEYKMSKRLADFYLKLRPSNVRPMEFLCKIVNEEFNLCGLCFKVIIEN